MKSSTMSFAEGFLGIQSAIAKKQGKFYMAFDWDKAAQLIKKALVETPNLIAEAGLQGDWDYTGGIIFQKGKPTNDSYTYLQSYWATPTLIISDENGNKLLETDCFETIGKFDEDSKWENESLSVLGFTVEDLD